MEAKGEKRQYRQPTQLKKDSIDNSAVLQLLLYSLTQQYELENELVRHAASISLIVSPKFNRTCVSALNKFKTLRFALRLCNPSCTRLLLCVSAFLRNCSRFNADLIDLLALFGVYAGIIYISLCQISTPSFRLFYAFFLLLRNLSPFPPSSFFPYHLDTPSFLPSLSHFDLSILLPPEAVFLFPSSFLSIFLHPSSPLLQSVHM